MGRSKHASRLSCAATVTSIALVILCAATPAFAQQTWTGSSDNAWGTAANWGVSLPTTSTALVFGSGTGSGGLNLNNNLTTGTGWNVNGITFQAGAPAFVIGDGTLTGNAGNAFTLSSNVTNNSTSLQTINTPFSMAATRTFTMTAGGGNIRLGGAVSGAGGVTTAGAGTLTLGGANSYTGATTIAAATTLNLASANALGNTSVLNMTGTTGTLINTSGSPITSAASGALFNGFTFGQAGDTSTNNLTLTGTADFSWGLSSSTPHTLTLNGNGTTLSMASRMIAGMNNANRFLNVNGAGNTLVLDGGIRIDQSTNGTPALHLGGNANVTLGPITKGAALQGNLVARSTGVLTLTGTSSDYGFLTLESGTTIITRSGALPTNSVNLGTNVAHVATFINDTGSQLESAASLVIGSHSSMTLGEDGDTSANNMTFLGTGQHAAGTHTITIKGTDVTIRTGGAFVQSSTVNRNFTLNGAGNTLVISGFQLSTGTLASITQSFLGAGTLVIDGNVTNGSTNPQNLSVSGNMVVRGAGTYAGTTTVGGSLRLGKAVSLYNANEADWQKTKITVNNGGTLTTNVGGADEFSAAQVATLLSNLSTSINNNGMRSGSRIGFDTSNAAGGVFEYSTAIANSNGTGSGAIGVLKTGSNSLRLTGVNTYTGATTISAGRLIVGPTGSVNTTSGISVSAGAAFDYNASTALSVAPSLLGNGSGNRATLGGVGAINAALTLNNLGDTLSPGNSPGIMPFGTSQTWNSFTYLWETNNFTGTTAGDSFDRIDITGSLNLTGGTGAYLLDITSLTAGNIAGDVPNFSETNRSWTILTTTSGITGFDAANWTLSTANFTSNPAATGSWELKQQGNNVVLDYVIAVPEPTGIALAGCGMLFLAWRAIGQRRRSPQHVER
jgi:fibronectin-binding autotransporter adhesin